MRILIAEDDDDTAEFIRRGLSELGHNPVVADNGVGRPAHSFDRGIRRRHPRPHAAAARRPVGASANPRRRHQDAGAGPDGARPDRGPRRRARRRRRRLSGQAVRLFRACRARQRARPAQAAARPGHAPRAWRDRRGPAQRQVSRDGEPVHAPAARVPDTRGADARGGQGRHPHHAARTGLELSFRSADQHRRHPNQSASLEAQPRRQARR